MNTAWFLFLVVSVVTLLCVFLTGFHYFLWALLDDWRSGRFSRKPKDPKEGEVYASRDMPEHEVEVVRTEDGFVHFRFGRAMHCNTVRQFHRFYMKLRDRMTP